MGTDSGYQYFTVEELQCHGTDCCGGQSDMDPDFMSAMVSIRRELGFALPVTSAYRCPLHNSRESSTGETGPHTTGHAMDISIGGNKAYLFMACAIRHGMTGIGFKQKGKHRFVHIDDLQGRLRPWIWSY